MTFKKGDTVWVAGFSYGSPPSLIVESATVVAAGPKEFRISSGGQAFGFSSRLQCDDRRVATSRRAAIERLVEHSAQSVTRAERDLRIARSRLEAAEAALAAEDE